MTENPLRSGIELSELSPGIRPQDDLFGHVNGRWLAEHVMPADRSSDGAFHALRDLSEERVREIVEEAAEVWMAAEYESDEAAAEEISQLLYHVQTMMIARGISLEDVYRHL